ncbi:transposase [Xenorhabdus sp. TS4]|nr:transposase [Xenorhabdus sp. TS4]
MGDKQLKTLATELAKNLKTPKGFSQFIRFLNKSTVETAFTVEMVAHLGYEKNQSKSGINTRNGYSSKTLLIKEGALELQIIRAMTSSEPRFLINT